MTAPERGWLLLCAELGTQDKPLTLPQLRQLRQRIRAAGPPETPDRALTSADLRALGYDAATADRIAALLQREAALDAYLEAGAYHRVVPLTPLSQAYPAQLRTVLGDDAPPVLFARGDLSLLQKQAVALVGSRRLEAQGLAFAERIGTLAAREGYVLISGNAQGADRAAQDACLRHGGSVISVLADSLADHVPGSRQLLLCEEGWHLPFSTQRALRRNRIVHALALRSFVAQTDCGFGGTWRGASDALRLGCAVFVQADASEGAVDLIRRGATPISLDELQDLSTLKAAQTGFL